MSSSSLRVEVVSAEKALFSGEVEMLVAPGAAGELGILPNHAPLLTNLRPGVLKIVQVGGKEELLYVAGGVLEVQPDQVTVLADVAERGEDLDEVRAEQARAEAERSLQAGATGMDYAKAQAELAQAAAQIELIRKLRGK